MSATLRAKARGYCSRAWPTTGRRCGRLETPVTTKAEVKPFNGWTNKFIFPPYAFSIPDALVTNFHLPSSTMLMSVAAFGGFDHVMNAYKTALKEGYSFGTYGDAMLIV